MKRKKRATPFEYTNTTDALFPRIPADASNEKKPPNELTNPQAAHDSGKIRDSVGAGSNQIHDFVKVWSGDDCFATPPKLEKGERKKGETED